MDGFEVSENIKDLSKEVPIRLLFFKSQFSKCRVSCVKCLDSFILAGVGDVLHIYNIASHKLAFKKQIFKGQNIYGVTFLNPTSEDSKRAIIWGGKELCLATITLEECINVFDINVWYDSVWIWDVLWMDTESFVTVGLNNSVTRWSCNSKSKDYVVYCEDQCILYSGKIIGDTLDNCIVLAGTVMQNILIWKPNSLICPTLHSLKGHKGAVFSVNYCPASNLIVSTSDDRSLRFWKVVFKTKNDWTTANISLISSVFGHTARVWQCVILNYPTSQKIISIGEDGLLCAWTLNGENTMRREAHQGGSVCSVDANLSTGLIVTGGVDGGLCQWSIQNHSDIKTKCIGFDCDSFLSYVDVDITKYKNFSQKGVLFNCDIPEAVIQKFSFNSNCDSSSSITESTVLDSRTENFSVESLVQKPVLDNDVVSCSDAFKKSNLKHLVLVRTGNIIASLDSGFLLGCSLKDLKWTLLFYDNRFANYHLLSVSASRKFISLASISGTILLFKDDSSETAIKLTFISEVQICTSKIFSLHWLSDKFFITCISAGILEIWNVTDTNGEMDVKMYQKCVLPPSKERWLTCTSLSGPHLLCGDRNGSIHYYNVESNKDISQTFKKIHHGGVCDVKWNIAKEEAYSVGRDGYLRHWIVNEGKVELLLTEKLPIKWPTRIFLGSSRGTIVHGFTASQVLIWSYHERKILLTQECGGGHRSWDCTFNLALVLVWIKDKCVQLRSFPLDNFSKPVLLEGFHCKEINALATCKGFSKDGKPCVFLLTGSEDTTLRVSSCPLYDLQFQSSFTDQCVFRSHVSSIRALASVPWTDQEDICIDQSSTVTFPSGENKHLVVSAGGRAQLKVWSFTTFGERIDKMVELGSHMLRGDDKSRRAGKYDSVDPEARYMAVDVVCLPKNQVYIFTACSDATIRIFHFDEKLKEISLKVEIDYHEACVLEICIKQICRNETDGVFEFLMLTMTTEGSIAVWKITIQNCESCKNVSSYTIHNPSQPSFVFSTHQSGVNSHALKPLSSSFLLATGGDDTAIVLSYFNLDDKVLKKQFIFDNAHEAQVSGITFTSNVPWILSTSTDQRVILWAYTYDPNLTLQYTAEYQSVVADIHGLSLLNANESMICVYGCGLEIISFEHEKVKCWHSKTSKKT